MKLAAISITRNGHTVVEMKVNYIDVDFIQIAKSKGMDSIAIYECGGGVCHHHNLLTGQYSKNTVSSNGRWKSVYSC